jgi:hypothetical protein
MGLAAMAAAHSAASPRLLLSPGLPGEHTKTEFLA